MKRFIVLAIIAIVLVSGCTSQSFFSGYETETKAEEPDIISFTSPTILPEIIFDGDSFDIDFQIINKHDSRDVENVGVWIENWNPCEITAINSVPEADLNAAGWGATYPGLEDTITKLTAGSSLPIGITLNANTPTNDLPGICKIIYRLNHSFEAITTFTGISIMETGAYRDLIKSGDRPAERPLQNIGTGPIQIVFNTEQRFPVEAVPDRQMTMSMNINNLGTGVFGDIDPRTVKIKIPYDLLLEDDKGNYEPCDRFNESLGFAEETTFETFELTFEDKVSRSLSIDNVDYKGELKTNTAGTGAFISILKNGTTIEEFDLLVGEETFSIKLNSKIKLAEINGTSVKIELSEHTGSQPEYMVFTNDKKIPMIEGESVTLRCILNANVDVPYEKSYLIEATHEYVYEMRGEIEVDVEVQ